MKTTIDFTALLSEELLENEKIRLSFIAGIAIIVLFIFSIVAIFDWPGAKLLNSYEPIYYFIGILLLLVIREFIIIKFVLKKIKNNKQRISTLRYINLFIEISIPSIIMIVFLSYFDNIFVLNTPAVSIYFLVIILTILNLDYKISFLAGFLASIQYFLIVYYAINNANIIESNLPTTKFGFYVGRGITLLISGILSGYIAFQLREKVFNSFQSIKEKNKIREIFGQQISNEIVTELLEKRNIIEPKKKFVSIMFVDIRGFTPFAETKEPEEIIEYQNQVFGFMADTIIKHNGVINQFLGDGYMATFGAPISKGNDCQNAVNASLEILEELKRKNDSKEIPQTRIGIGLHAGEVVTGNVGSKNRQQYSISGNTVIISARIEQLTKEYKSQLLITKELKDHLEEQIDQFDLVGPVVVKGREKAIEIYKWNKDN